MYSEAERVQLARWMGIGRSFRSNDPRLDVAITASQSRVDGGSMPDSETECAVRGWLASLATIEASWLKLTCSMQTVSIDEIHVDPLRGLVGIFKLGRMYIGFISDAIDFRPIRDVFTSPQTNPSNEGQWPR